MNILVYVILPMIGNLFLILSIFYGLKEMGCENPGNTGKRYLVIAVYSILSLLASLLGNGIINLLFLLILPFAARWIYQTGRIYLLYYFIAVIVVYLADALFSILFSSIMGGGAFYLNSSELSFCAYVVTLRLIEFLLIRIFVLVVKKKREEELTARQLVIAFLLPLFSIVNLYSITYFMQIYITEEMLLLFLVNLVLLIAINIYFAVISDTVGENNRLERELVLSRQQAQFQADYYTREEEKYEESRKLIHDIRNHIQTMDELYRESQAEAKPETRENADNYMEHLRNSLNDLGQKYYTSNRLLNIILNDKVSQMKKRGITPDIRIGEVQLSFMREIDITTIFANLLDNAIDAAENGSIKLRASQSGGLISVLMENSCVKEPETRKGTLKSSKKNHEGLGMKNVARALENYDGDLQWQWENEVFVTSIMLVNREESLGM